ERRRPFRRRVEIRRLGIRTVVGNRILGDAEELIADQKFVSELELYRRANPQEDTVASLEIDQPEAPLPVRELCLSRMAENLSGQVDRPGRSDDRLVFLGLVAIGPTGETAQHVQAKAILR